MIRDSMRHDYRDDGRPSWAPEVYRPSWRIVAFALAVLVAALYGLRVL